MAKELTPGEAPDLYTVAKWFVHFYEDVQRVAPEYRQRAADPDASESLYLEAKQIVGEETNAFAGALSERN